MFDLGVSVLAQSSSSGGGGAGAILFLLIQLAVLVLTVASLWMMFSKAGFAGWLALIPLVNLFFLVKLTGKSGWLFLLFLIPLVNIIMAIWLAVEVSKAFGKGILFAIGVFFLPMIFYAILGFGDAEYQY